MSDVPLQGEGKPRPYYTRTRFALAPPPPRVGASPAPTRYEGGVLPSRGDPLRSPGRRWEAYSIKHLPGMQHQQNTLLFATFPLLRVDFPIVSVSQVDEPAAFLGDTGGQGHRDARRFDSACS